MVKQRQPTGKTKATRAAAKPAPSKAKPTFDEARLRQELIAELDQVRLELQQALEALRLRLEGEITQAQEVLAAPDPAVDGEDRSSRAATMAALLEEARALHIKPEKGRRRDLKRLEDLADTLRERMTGW
jgi:hypothetical protein